MASRSRPADTSLVPAVQTAIDALTLEPADTGAVQLARRYAATIDAADDDGDTLDKLGPKLLACLDALGATPKSRAATRKGDSGAPTASPLDELRARRQRRAAG